MDTKEECRGIEEANHKHRIAGSEPAGKDDSALREEYGAEVDKEV